MRPEFTARNPIVETAQRIRARRDLGVAIDAATGEAPTRRPEDAQESLRAFADALTRTAQRLNAILEKRGNGVKIIRLERPLRLRIRFGEERIALDLDDVNQLVRIVGGELDGDYQFDLSAAIPSLINLSKISTQADYGEALTASGLLKHVARNAELPPPAHLSGSGPLQF